MRSLKINDFGLDNIGRKYGVFFIETSYWKNMNRFLIYFFCFAIVIVITVIVALLSKHKNPIMGVIPIVIIGVIMFTSGIYCEHVCNGYTVFKDDYAMKNGCTATILIKTQNDKVVDFSHIYIRTETGALMDVEQINGNDDADRYDTIIKYFVNKHSLDGESIRKEWVTTESATFDNSRVTPQNFYYGIFILTLPFLCIYVLSRMVYKRKYLKDELKRFNIKLGL